MAERKAILVRLPSDLAEAIQKLAAADLRSVNGEIEYLLREAVRRRMRQPSDRETEEK